MSPLCSDSHAQEAGGRASIYRRRRPERTVVYQVVQEHLETWLAHYNEAEPESNPVPHYIERGLRKFLECGILAHGFARAYCDHCGRDFLIAYSCKGRGICPSCHSKRMAAVAAHLVDEVFPCVPVRQWVISFPKRLRYFLLHNFDLTNRVIRIAVGLIEHQLIQSARAPGTARIGAVFCLHHFGSSLNVHLHFHVAICDGFFYVTTTEVRARAYPSGQL
ncbi:transposase zinc-binding domain-containing protein [Gammaproteobacteria bacterium]|nr:transposase zinc-binding domain-containing protein [Gammaproteobacteria bacterium]